MKIGIVTETYPPETNGVALTVQGLLEGLREAGHDVQLVRPRQAHESAASAPAGMLCVPGATLPGYAGLRFGWPATRQLMRVWGAWQPDVVYVATEGPLGHSALRCAERLGIPVTTGFHTRFDHYARHYRLGWLAPLVRRHLRRFHRRGRATLVPTRALAAELQAMGIDNARLLSRAVDTGQFAPQYRDPALRRQWGVADDVPVMLYVGRIAAEKNLDLALRAFAAMRASVPNLHYVWVGDGPERAALERAHPECIFMGMQHGADLARCYASADLFVFPSRSETFGNVILEALASGLATVAYDCGAAREHIRDGHNGYRVQEGDEAAFLDACVHLVRDGRYRDMRASARASVVMLSPDAVIADFDCILSDVAGAGPEPLPAHYRPVSQGLCSRQETCP